jgi:RNA polymerase sigma-54 factor
MLELSNLQLTSFLEGEIQQNPLLQWQSRGFGETVAADDADAGERLAPRDRAERLRDASMARRQADHWQPERVEDGDRPIDSGDEETQPSDRCNGAELDHTATRSRTLREHLLEQIGADFSDPGDRVIALHLLDLLDEDGYLRADLDGVTRLLGCGKDRVEGVLERLQQFDPAGVFARDLKECLTLQLRDRNRFGPAMQALLDHLPFLATRNVAAIVRVCHVDAADVAEMINEIKSLDPRPGLAFDPPPAQPVVPDILMRAQPQGGWFVELNAETLPRVLVNNSYYAQVRQATRNKAEKDYLTERLHAANWLVKSLHQRATTILKVATEIIRQQDAFFRDGVSALRPLIPRDIADAIGMHESTVSRAISNKYMATPRGLYELKYFFTSAIPASGGSTGQSTRHHRWGMETGMLSRNLEKSLHRALAYANERRHEYATLEHLLLALTEDQDAVAVLRACGVDLDRLRREVLNYVDNELGDLVAAHGDDAKPTASFQRALQRAAIHVQSSGREEVTGANVLVAMFAERESHAVYLLQEQDMTRFDAVNYISHGIPKAPGRSETRRVHEETRSASPRYSGGTPPIDETKIIAAILCGQTIIGKDLAIDPVREIVDLYERILAELRSRGHGSRRG